MRRAWIEIHQGASAARLDKQSPSVRRAWIEIGDLHDPNVFLASPSVRRAWIEIRSLPSGCTRGKVALREEGVD